MSECVDEMMIRKDEGEGRRGRKDDEKRKEKKRREGQEETQERRVGIILLEANTKTQTDTRHRRQGENRVNGPTNGTCS